jgi:hypothetical protein
MIIYYNPENLTIIGMSHTLDQAKSDPYIVTDDPVADKIFLGQEKLMLYRLELINPEVHSGKLVKLTPTTSSVSQRYLIKDYHYLIPSENTDLSVVVTQDLVKKTVNFDFSGRALDEWKDTYRSGALIFLACRPYDIYSILWTLQLKPENINQPLEYQGTDNFCFFTRKLFKGYCHVIT